MPLTNPNKVVTEERLSEFYGQILPYMGGMPDVLANKFSKGDLYSTDEKMIGCWTDGKPLYQKTIDFGTLPKENLKSVNHGISNIDKVIKIWANASDNSNYIGVPIPYSSTINVTDGTGITLLATPTQVQISTGIDRTAFYAYVTIQYTKTTDSPIAIGSESDYSTDEKIVGTWIDGKPLYQRVINFTTPNNSNWTSVATITGADFIMLVSARIQSNDGTNLWTTVPFTNPAGTHCCAVNVGTNKDLVCYVLGNFLNRPAFAIVQYTKTTD